jgi:hypothetical protein
MILLLLTLLLIDPGSRSAVDQPKTHMKRAEELLKEGKPIEAYQEAKTAVTEEPNNKKFRQKLAQIGQLASKVLETKARAKMETEPQAVRALLHEALECDPSNSSADQALTDFDAKVFDASTKSKQVRELLDSGRLTEAHVLLNSIARYNDLIPEIETVRQSAVSEEHISAAETMVSAGNMDQAIQEVVAADAVSVRPQYVLTKSASLRRQLSDYYLSQLSSDSANSPRELLKIAHSVNKATAIDPQNPRALKAKDQMVGSVHSALLSLNGVDRPDPALARVRLAQANLVEEELKDNQQLLSQRASLTSLSYPLVRLRLVVGPVVLPAKLDSQGLGF